MPERPLLVFPAPTTADRGRPGGGGGDNFIRPDHSRQGTRVTAKLERLQHSLDQSVQSPAEAARQRAYRLYTLCEREGWAEVARGYNELVTSWSAVESNASHEPAHKQGELF